MAHVAIHCTTTVPHEEKAAELLTHKRFDAAESIRHVVIAVGLITLVLLATLSEASLQIFLGGDEALALA